MKDVCAIVLAAGEGTRMRSRTPKLLHPLLGQPLIHYAVELCLRLGAKRVLVVGAQAEEVKGRLAGRPVEFVHQGGAKGTGHAVRQAEEGLRGFDGTLLILAADTPLLREETVRQFVAAHHKAGAVATLLTASVANPAGYGRILRDDQGRVRRIAEEAEATFGERQVNEINAGVYCFASATLFQALQELQVLTVKREVFLPEVVQYLAEQKYTIYTPCCADANEVIRINTRAELAEAAKVLRQRVQERLMSQGVSLVAPGATYIDETVQIGPDTVIYPGVFLEGTTTIGAGCVIYPHCRISNSHLGEHVTVLDGSIILASEIAEGCVIGPYAHLRPHSRLKRKAKVGNFCEVKNAVIGEGSKVPHLAYIGDTVMGEQVNIGAGTITCNYDGFAKHETVIEDEVFVGSNTNLVAPVTVGRGAVIAAGSTITEAIPPDAVAFGRAPQVTKEGRAAKTRKKRQAMAGPKPDYD